MAATRRRAKHTGTYAFLPVFPFFPLERRLFLPTCVHAHTMRMRSTIPEIRGRTGRGRSDRTPGDGAQRDPGAAQRGRASSVCLRVSLRRMDGEEGRDASALHGAGAILPSSILEADGHTPPSRRFHSAHPARAFPLHGILGTTIRMWMRHGAGAGTGSERAREGGRRRRAHTAIFVG